MYKRQEVDIYKAKCTVKQYPLVIKHENETSLCSSLGADGRQTDLEGNIHTVQIGWNMSAVKPGLEIKEMVSIIFKLSIFVCVCFILLYITTSLRLSFVSTKKYSVRCGLSISFVVKALHIKTKEIAPQALGPTILGKKDISMVVLLLELKSKYAS